MKRCSRCGKELEESEFNFRHRSRGVLQSVCRDCQHEQSKSHYDRNSQVVKDKSAVVKRKARNEAEYFFYDYLSNSTCTDCGEYDFSVLTFDHVRGKKRMDVSRMMAEGYSTDAIREEIYKCDVVCANCHMRRTNERKSGGRFRKHWPRWPWEEE